MRDSAMSISFTLSQQRQVKKKLQNQMSFFSPILMLSSSFILILIFSLLQQEKNPYAKG